MGIDAPRTVTPVAGRAAAARQRDRHRVHPVGGHIFPIYDGCRSEGIRLIDARHEQTAAFAAEGWSKVTRVPGVVGADRRTGMTNG